jgi:hypothetical protein
MRKQALRLFFGVSLSVLLAVVSAVANSGLNVWATIPFDFTVGEETLPAGTYTLQAINSYGLLAIRNEDYTRGILIMTGAKEAKNEPGPAKLIFRKYCDLYFLGEVWGYDAGRALSKSSKERQVIRERRNHLAKGAAEPTLVYIAAN